MANEPSDDRVSPKPSNPASAPSSAKRATSISFPAIAALVLVALALLVWLAILLWFLPDLLKPVIFGFPACLTVLFAVYLGIALYRRDEISVESRSRGFGGGLAGCRMSAALGLLIAVIVFGALTVAAGTALVRAPTTPTPTLTVAAAAATTIVPTAATTIAPNHTPTPAVTANPSTPG